jgi:hypothetical protein
MTLIKHNIVDLWWGVHCRVVEEMFPQHEQCFGLYQLPPEDGSASGTQDFTRCVCPCHDGFDPVTGER